MIILDTNAYSALANGNENVVRILEKAEQVLVPSVVLGELFAGFYIGHHTEQNIHMLELFLSKPGVRCAEITKNTAERYGLVITELRKQGTPIPTNDVWIAATVLETGGRLLSRDNHFEHVPGVFRTGF